MSQLWCKNYPAGVSEEINPEKYASLVDLLETSFEKYNDRPAFHNMGTTLSYEELREQAQKSFFSLE